MSAGGGDLYQLADQFRAALLAQERAAATELVKAYGGVWQDIQGRLSNLTSQMAHAAADGQALDINWLFQADRLRSFQLQVEAQINRFAQYADTSITGAQAQAVQAAQRDAAQLATAQAGMSLTFDQLPDAAVERLVGHLADGSPLRDLLNQLGPDAGQAARSALLEGIATGQGQATIARTLRRSLGGNLVRALTISRTETLRAYREASRQTWRQHSDVVIGWIWVAGHSSHTCAFCWSMDGSVHPLDEQMASHPRCRCTMVPKTKTWAQLGMGGPTETQFQRPPGAVTFAKLKPAVQAEILGPAKYAAHNDGTITLKDLQAFRTDPRWGRSGYEASLAQALANARVRMAGGPPSQPGLQPPAPAYPQLSKKLQGLSGDALLLWGDQRARTQAFQDVLAAWRGKSQQALDAAIQRVDDAVDAGMTALGYPRGPVNSVKLEIMRGASGAKDPNCDILINPLEIARNLKYGQHADETWRTWVHESLHARQTFAPTLSAEYRAASGYEEGMVDGLARLIVADQAGMVLPAAATMGYTSYVIGYRALASVLGVDEETLLARVWRFAAGTIRRNFPDILDAYRSTPLTLTERGMVRAYASRLFATANMRATVVEQEVIDAWAKLLLPPAP